MTTPGGDFPDDAISSDDLSPLSGLDEASWRAGISGRAVDGFNEGHFSLLGLVSGLVQVGVDLVVGAVQVAVDTVTGIFSAVGSLFGASSRDMSAVDKARVDAENAIVANMSDSLEQLDEIQRFGGAYMDYEAYSVWDGELFHRVLPLSAVTPLAAGTGWIPPNWPLTHSASHQYGKVESESRLPRGSGQLEILEPGLWIIYFQAALRQGPAYDYRPVMAWCYVTPADSPYLPVGTPGLFADGSPNPGHFRAWHRDTGGYIDDYDIDDVAAYGRAAAYTTDEQAGVGGGYTLFGMTYAYLQSGGWKVSMADMSFEKFGGAASTFVVAQKMNSETLRDDIDSLKTQIASALPGQNVPLELTDAQIAAMVAQSEGVQVDPVTVPEEAPDA